MTDGYVTDASALLALPQREPGGDAVAMILATAIVRARPVVTADRAWSELALGIPVKSMR